MRAARVQALHVAAISAGVGYFMVASILGLSFQ